MNCRYRYLAFLLVFALLFSGCAGSFSDQPPQSTSAGETTPAPSEIPAEETPDRGELRPAQTLPTELEPVEFTPPAPVTGEVPEEILKEIIADLVERAGAVREDIQLISAEAVVWNDGALGCPKPGEFYFQMLINGYWVVLEVEGVEYDYRVSDKGSFKLCEHDKIIIEPAPLMPVFSLKKTPKINVTLDP